MIWSGLKWSFPVLAGLACPVCKTKVKKVLTREEILSLGIEELLAQLKSSQLQPVVVLQAYQAKVLVVNKEINAVCDFIVEATEHAEALALPQVGERGPLHGLLISVKVLFGGKDINLISNGMLPCGLL